MHETSTLAAFTGKLDFADIPAPSIAMAKTVLLDGIACLLAGSRSPLGRGAAHAMGQLGGTAQATIMTSGLRTTARDAAFANAMALYSVGLNDIHKPSGSHPGGCIIPVVLALGEWLDVPGRDMLVAMIAGYEINGRIGRAIKSGHRARGFHPTGTCGTFGAAAAAGRLFGRNQAQMLDIFGIAGSQASGLYEFHHTGSTTMVYHAGRAAQNGIEAVLMADAGVTGPETVLEGRQGFFVAMSEQTDITEIRTGLGERFMVDETSLRPHFGCNSTKATSSALAALFKSGQCRPDEVAGLTISLNPVPARDNDIPIANSLLAARLSVQFNAALVLATGNVLVRDLEQADLTDTRVTALTDRVTIRSDAGLPRYGCNIVVSLKDGTTRTCSDAGKRGDPDDALSWTDVVEKFLRMTAGIIGSQAGLRLVDGVAGLEDSSGHRLAAQIRGALVQAG